MVQRYFPLQYSLDYTILFGQSIKYITTQAQKFEYYDEPTYKDPEPYRDVVGAASVGHRNGTPEANEVPGSAVVEGKLLQLRNETSIVSQRVHDVPLRRGPIPVTGAAQEILNRDLVVGGRHLEH